MKSHCPQVGLTATAQLEYIYTLKPKSSFLSQNSYHLMRMEISNTRWGMLKERPTIARASFNALTSS
ncbi:unnamed protein product [Amoebophrya sp. A25]|nr:unnamed protein product [Amoebophrya sp. A25]|eukprot:GSA25T00011207001.1